MLPFKYRGQDYILQTRCLSPRLLICLISIMCIKTLFKDLKFSSNSAFECIRCLHPFIYLKGVDDVAHNWKTPGDCNGISLQKKGYREPNPSEYIRLRREWWSRTATRSSKQWWELKDAKYFGVCPKFAGRLNFLGNFVSWIPGA